METKKPVRKEGASAVQGETVVARTKCQGGGDTSKSKPQRTYGYVGRGLGEESGLSLIA